MNLQQINGKKYVMLSPSTPLGINPASNVMVSSVEPRSTSCVQLLLFVALLLASCKPVPLTEMKIPFTGESVIDTIDGEPYRYFRYETSEATEADIAKVSPDGSRIGGKRMRWEGPVHIYAFRKRIVMYVGSNPKVISTIEEVFGPQIAGDPVELLKAEEIQEE